MSADTDVWGPNGIVHAPEPAAPAADSLADTPAPPPDKGSSDPTSPDFDLRALGAEVEQAQMEKVIANGFDMPPPTPASYRFDRPKDPAAFDPELDSAARGAFHAERFDQGTAQTLYREWTKAASSEQSPLQERMEHAACEKALRLNWGGDYDRNLKLANAEVNRIAAAYPKFPIKDMLANTSLGNNAFLIRTLVNRAQARGGK